MRKSIRAVVVVGARPNFMKAAPILRAMQASGKFDAVLVHTGQHYDSLMSDVFFKDLDMPKPDIYLGIGSMPREEQIAAIEKSLMPTLRELKPDVVVVVGDVNSTLAAAKAAKAEGIKVVHVEAGLRSGDLTMAEEINRIATDKISDFLFTTEEAGNKNLKEEKISGKAYLVGNTMIDSLEYAKSKINQELDIPPQWHFVPPTHAPLLKDTYAVLTLHRPSNVDDKVSLLKILNAFYFAQQKMTYKAGKNIELFQVVFPVHPRTEKQLKSLSLEEGFKDLIRFRRIQPLGYADFIKLMEDAKFVMTDSGGIQEEASYLGIPCITLRDNTERPVTVIEGTNVLVRPSDANFASRLKNEVQKIMAGRSKKGRKPPIYWDGKAAERIVNILVENL